MPKYDGSVTINTKMDTGDVMEGIRNISSGSLRLRNNIKKTQDEIEQLNRKMDELSDVKIPTDGLTALDREIETIEKKINAIRAKGDRFVELGGDPKSSKIKAMIYDIEQMEIKLEDAKEAKEELLKSGEAYTEGTLTEKYQGLEKKLAAATNRLKVYNKQLEETARKENRVGEKLDKFGRRLLNMGASVYLFSTIHRSLTSVQTEMNAMLKTDKEFVADLAVIKGNLRIAFQPLYEYVVPGIKTFTAVLRTATGYMAQFTAAISGKSISQMKQNAEALYEQEKALEGIDNAAKSAKGSLSKYDNLNVSNVTSSSGAGTSDTSPVFEDIQPNEKLAEWLEEMQARMGPFNESLDKLLGALGRFGKGIGSGFVDFLKDVSYWLADVASFLFPTAFNKIADWLNNMDEDQIHDIGYALGALAAAILLYKAGSATIQALGALQTGLDWFVQHGTIKTELKIVGVAAALTALHLVSQGVRNEFDDFEELKESAQKSLGKLPGWMYAYTVELFSGEYSLSELWRGLWQEETWDDVWDKVFTNGTEQNLAAKFSAGLLATAASVKWMPFGKELLAGAATAFAGFDLGKEIGNSIFGQDGRYQGNLWDQIKFMLSIKPEEWSELGDDWIHGMGVIGDSIKEWWMDTDLVKDFTSVGDEVKESWKNLEGFFKDELPNWWNNDVDPWFTKDQWEGLLNESYEGWETGWNIIKDWWNNTAMKQWWDKNVSPWFTKKTWVDAMGGIKEGWVTSWTNALNAVIDKLNAFIGFVNEKLKINIPTIETSSKGASVTKSRQVSMMNASVIPHLATGTVIPPNREFMAVLGDQKQGVNIEAPANLIKQMVIEGLREAQGTEGDIHITVELDGNVVFKNVVKRNKQYKRQTGKSALA